jgi:nitrogen fixation/metabolism regulation signal transduction histidine kinase
MFEGVYEDHQREEHRAQAKFVAFLILLALGLLFAAVWAGFRPARGLGNRRLSAPSHRAVSTASAA